MARLCCGAPRGAILPPVADAVGVAAALGLGVASSAGRSSSTTLNGFQQSSFSDTYTRVFGFTTPLLESCRRRFAVTSSLGSSPGS